MWVILGTLLACAGEKDQSESGPDPAGSSDLQPGTITISLEQFQTGGMRVGDPERVQFSNQVGVKGYIRPSVSGMAKISPLVSGRVSRIYHSVGDRVGMGDPLFSIEGQEIVALQQEYAAAVHELNLLRSEYDRYQALSEEKVVAEKELQRSQSRYFTLKAKTEGLRSRLLMIGLDPAEVEKGHIASKLFMTAPIDGVISERNLVLGQFIESPASYMEIIDPGKLQLELRVFEQDIAELAAGQDVVFVIPGREGQQFHAVLASLGNSIDPESKTILCIAALSDRQQGILVNNLYVEAEVTTCEREALVVPETAIINEAEKDFVWVRMAQTGHDVSFRKTPVETGMTREGYTELLDEDLSEILLQGAYSLSSDE